MLNPMKSSFLLLLLLFLPVMLSCSEDDPLNNDGDPLNLIVNFTVHENGLVSIEAIADNATEYQLWLGMASEPEATNTTGVFEHTYEQSGNYRIEIRAYGASGRFLREVLTATVIIAGDDVSPEDGYVSPLFYEGYELVWFDEFDGPGINPNHWVFETGTGCPNLCGWGNQESQYYREENAWVEDGILTIEARSEFFSGSQYTSARMKTQGKKSFQYGRVDIRALLPKGQGIWPALWMLGNNITTVGWPACGEIDIMEMVGGDGRENTTHGTLHWDNNGHTYTGGSHTLSSGTFADKYHVFSIVWDETRIRWLLNNVQFHEILITPAHMTEFHQEFFFIFNVAVGGLWPGYPDNTTIFPQQMRVDYIRVFQKN